MNENKRTQLKQALEIAQNKLKELKTADPNGNYEELENMIQRMNDMIYHSNPQKITFFIFIKILLAFLSPYLFCTIGVSVLFGFMSFILNPIEPARFISIIPLTSLILFLAFRVYSIISNRFATKNPIFMMLILSGILIVILAFIDTTWIHLCGSFSDSILLAGALVLMGLIVDLYVAQKILMFVGEYL